MSGLCTRVLVKTDRAIQRLLSGLVARTPKPRTLLDVGCWDGAATLRYAGLLGCAAHGIEVFGEPAARARAQGVEVAEIDLERARFPWADGAMDVVIVNQVLEHLKNLWLAMSEVHRVTRRGGHLLLSVPNLASLHNRILLGLGRQPSSIRVFGPHVRGFAFGEIRRLVTLGGCFVVERALGVGFHPLPARLAAPFARLWPGGSHTALILARKLDLHPRDPWLAHLEREQDHGLPTWYG